MSERKLASVQKITDITPIEGRDRIVLATVEGWHVIVSKKDFKVGDLCVYIEIDSVLPERPEFEQARKRGSRIRTMKMAGVYSEGIVYPLNILPNMIDDHTISYNQYHEGDDVTAILGITKYDEYAGEEPVGVSKSKKKYNKLQLLWYKLFGFPQRKKGGFTTLVSKTDEVRIQNIPEALQNKEPVVVTEKVDGCSMTATIEHTFFGNKFNLYSRNLCIGKDNSHYWRAAEMYDLEDRMSLMMEELGVKWIAIQGEVAGPVIQKNPYGLKDIDFFVFNIITPEGRWSTKKMVEFCYRYGLTTVPVLDYNYKLPDTVEGMLQYATNKSIINPNALREGVVIRSQDGKQSFKAVSPECLVKHGK